MRSNRSSLNYINLSGCQSDSAPQRSLSLRVELNEKRIGVAMAQRFVRVIYD